MNDKPLCPKCERSDAVYPWVLDKPQIYCAHCMRVWDLEKGEDIGGQDTLF